MNGIDFQINGRKPYQNALIHMHFHERTENKELVSFKHRVSSPCPCLAGLRVSHKSSVSVVCRLQSEKLCMKKYKIVLLPITSFEDVYHFVDEWSAF